MAYAGQDWRRPKTFVFGGAFDPPTVETFWKPPRSNHGHAPF